MGYSPWGCKELDMTEATKSQSQPSAYPLPILCFVLDGHRVWKLELKK